MTGRTPSDVLQLDPLEFQLAARVAAEVERDRREFQADLIEALGKSLAGK